MISKSLDASKSATAHCALCSSIQKWSCACRAQERTRRDQHKLVMIAYIFRLKYDLLENDIFFKHCKKYSHMAHLDYLQDAEWAKCS